MRPNNVWITFSLTALDGGAAADANIDIVDRSAVDIMVIVVDEANNAPIGTPTFVVADHAIDF